MKWVKWIQWGECGAIDHGQMPVNNIQSNMQKFEAEAANLMKEQNCDHVLYGLVDYNEDDEIEKVNFYLLPMSDKEFDEKVSSVSGRVYALHNRRS